MNNEQPINKLVTQAINSTAMPSRRWPHLRKAADSLLSRHGDLKAFAVANNPDAQKAVAVNEEKAVLGESPMLCTLDAAYGEGSALLWLIPQLHDLCKTVGVKVKLDDVQLRQLATMIRSEFGYLKATEVMLFIYRLKGGHYGEFYGAVDPMRIMRALRGRFAEERTDIITRHENEKKDLERQQWAKTAVKGEELTHLLRRLNNNEQ